MVNNVIKKASFPWNGNTARSVLIEGPIQRNCQGAGP
jgi:hypothetical protein